MKGKQQRRGLGDAPHPGIQHQCCVTWVSWSTMVLRQLMHRRTSRWRQTPPMSWRDRSRRVQLRPLSGVTTCYKLVSASALTKMFMLRFCCFSALQKFEILAKHHGTAMATPEDALMSASILYTQGLKERKTCFWVVFITPN